MHEYECKYCNNKFNSLSSLNFHIKNAKYCIFIQGKIISDEKNQFKCHFCLRIISSKQKLTKHENICNKKKDFYSKNETEFLREQLIKQEEQYKELLTKQEEHYKESLTKQEEHYKELLTKQEENCKELHKTIERLSLRAIDKPTTTNNNTTNNNILSITSTIDFDNIDNIKNIIDHDFDINYAINGQKGAAQFLVDKFLKDENGNLKYICTDPSRQIFKFKNSKGEIQKDVEAKKLTNYIADGGIKQKTVHISNKWYTNEEEDIDMEKFNLMLTPQQEILNLKNDNNTFKKELAAITS